MGGLYLQHVVAVAAVCSVLATGTLGSPLMGPEPIRCATCTPEKLSQCPAVAPECAEVMREPGCGCCLACALKAGELCGIYTAPCGSGLRCTPRPGDLRPLHSLTRGQAVCAAESSAPEQRPEPLNQDHQPGPCHVELQRALERIAKSQQKLGDRLNRFYLPNCDKHGLYQAKQCESSLDGQRGRCWCVSPWNGKRILGSSDLQGDAECP
ncbi:insulin-like growth factor-binding protein 1a [Diretmus argenteus]